MIAGYRGVLVKNKRGQEHVHRRPDVEHVVIGVLPVGGRWLGPRRFQYDDDDDDDGDDDDTPANTPKALRVTHRAAHKPSASPSARITSTWYVSFFGVMSSFRSEDEKGSARTLESSRARMMAPFRIIPENGILSTLLSYREGERKMCAGVCGSVYVCACDGHIFVAVILQSPLKRIHGLSPCQ